MIVPGALRGNRSLQLGLAVLAPFVIFVLVPGLIAPYGADELVTAPFQPPSSEYPLGTDEVGRDLLSRLVFAARIDVVTSVVSTLLAAVVGTSIGLLAGYVGSTLDMVVMRLTDVVLAFPSILLAIFLITVVGRGTIVTISALALLFTPGFVRLARGLALSIKERGFVESSVVSGGGRRHVLWRHLLPNAAGPLLVGIALTAATSLLVAASLSYLGVGIQPPTPSWGNMLQTSFQWLFQAPLYGIMPGACIALVALGYTWVADGIQHAISPDGRRVRTVSAVAREIAPAANPGGAGRQVSER